MLDDSINDSKRGGDRSETGGGVEEAVLKGEAQKGLLWVGSTRPPQGSAGWMPGIGI